MGCWEETCAITSTPIYSGDPCVMVVLNHEYLKRLLDTVAGVGYIGSMGSSWQWKVVEGIYRGTYNDYGWLEEIDRERHHNLPAIFFHAEIWDWIVSLEEEVPYGGGDWFDDYETKMSKLVVTPELRQFAKVCRRSYTLRRNIFAGLAFRGHQEWVEESIKDALLSLQTEIIARQKRKYAEEAEDEVS